MKPRGKLALVITKRWKMMRPPADSDGAEVLPLQVQVGAAARNPLSPMNPSAAHCLCGDACAGDS